MDATQLGLIRSAWHQAHRRNSTLALIDLSGSMNGDFGDTGLTKLQAVKQLMVTAYTVASPQAKSGACFFTNRGGSPVIDDLKLQTNGRFDDRSSHAQQIVTATRPPRLAATPRCTPRSSARTRTR